MFFLVLVSMLFEPQARRTHKDFVVPIWPRNLHLCLIGIEHIRRGNNWVGSGVLLIQNDFRQVALFLIGLIMNQSLPTSFLVSWGLHPLDWVH